MSLFDKMRGRSSGRDTHASGASLPDDDLPTAVPTRSRAERGATTTGYDSRMSRLQDEGVSIISEVEPSQLSGLGSADPLAPQIGRAHV